MENNNKVISIRLIYIILFIAAIIGVILCVKNYQAKDKNADTQPMYTEIEASSNSLTIARTENEDTSSRSEELSRQSEENVENNTENNDENSTESQVENQEQTQENTVENNTLNETEEKSEEENQTETTENTTAENEETVETNYISVSEVKISQGMDLTQRTGLSREDFINLIAGVKQDTSGFFEENAGLIYDLCEEYSLNEIFFCGIISAESGWDIASNHRSTHNYISLMVNGKLKSFDSVESGLREAARVLHTNYLTPGGKFYYGKTLAAMKTKFCPASSTWVSLVYGRMSQII